VVNIPLFIGFQPSKVQDFAGPSTVLFGTHGTQKNARNPALTMDTRPGMAVSENICQGE